MRILVWTFRILLFALFLGFALLNTDKATVDFLFGRWSAPLALIAFVFFVAGGLFGVLVMTPTVVRHKKALRRARDVQPPPPQTAPAEPPRLG